MYEDMRISQRLALNKMKPEAYLNEMIEHVLLYLHLVFS